MRVLELTIRLNEKDFEVDVYEPETGEVKQMQFPYSLGGNPEFDKAIGEEIHSWISMWAEEMEGSNEK